MGGRLRISISTARRRALSQLLTHRAPSKRMPVVASTAGLPRLTGVRARRAASRSARRSLRCDSDVANAIIVSW